MYVFWEEEEARQLYELRSNEVIVSRFRRRIVSATSMREKMYKKQELRLTLERNMKTTVTAKEFARWFGIYCDMKGKSDDIRNAKELEQAEVEELGDWMGYTLIE